LDSFPTPGDRNQFEANADRAREDARTLVTESLAEEAASQRRAGVDAGSTNGPVGSFLDRIRASLGSIRHRR
jgi:hypothetical protein